jgi:hypothetical protein
MGPAMSLALSDAQVNHIQLVSQPLQPQERAAFMARLFEDLLMRREEVGDGELGRLLRDLQGALFQAAGHRRAGSSALGQPQPRLQHPITPPPQAGQARRALESRRSARARPRAG